HTPKENESNDDTIQRAKWIVATSNNLNKYPFKMQVKQEPVMLIRAAKELLQTRDVNEFRGTEQRLRSGDKSAVDEVRKEQRAAADNKMSKLTGDEMVAGAEAQKAKSEQGVNREEDAMIERISAAEEARKGAFVADETDLPPKEI